MKLIFDMIKNAGLTPALESDVQDGKTFKENEHEFYVEISDFEQLKKAKSMDLQEQWNIKVPKTDSNAAKGALRIRQIVAGDVNGGPNQKPEAEAQYVLNTKVDQGPGRRLEVPVPTTLDAFNLFAMLSDSGMIKHRYHFPVDDLVFEVDMFLLPEGGYAPVAKIDLEVKSMDGKIPDLPIKVDRVIKGDTNDKAERDQITAWFDQYFITKNKFDPKAVVALESLEELSIAQEGFFSAILDFFKRKEPKQVEQPPSKTLYNWLEDNFQNGVLNPDLKLNGRSVSPSDATKVSGLYYCGNQALTNATAIVDAYRRDLKELASISASVMPSARSAMAVLAKFRKATDDPKALQDYKSLKNIIMSFRGKLPEPLCRKFSEAKRQRCGNYTTTFLRKSQDGGGIVWESEAKGYEARSITLEPLDAPGMTKLIALAKELGQFSSKTFDITDEVYSVDQTDQPFRRYSEIGHDLEVLNVLDPFSHPLFEELYTDIFCNLSTRAWHLEEAIWTYIRLSTSK